MIAVRIAVGLAMTLTAFAVAGRRVLWLTRLIRSGQPDPGRFPGIGGVLRIQLVEVAGQRRLLKWTVPGIAHAATFWGFTVLFLCIVEAYGSLFSRHFAIPVIGHWAVIGFLEDFFTAAVLVALATFAVIRVRNAPDRRHRASRFFGSHTGPAWLILAMISLVMITQTLFRAAQVNAGEFPYSRPAGGGGAFLSELVAKPLHPLGEAANGWLATVFVLANIGVILAFLGVVVYSKHLHIGLAPINVATKREPKALGPLLPIQVGGQVLDFEQLDELDEDAALGVGKVEDFTWKGLLDFATCTECGRCQSQCPAWNTEKPLSPKLLIMGLRDHMFATAPWLLATEEERKALPAGAAEVPLVGATGYASHGGTSGQADPHGDVLGSLSAYGAAGGVIDPDVLWSCVTCGACVEQCPVDIEHVDHIVDMRRYQVLIESAFPNELNGLFKNLEKQSNPWGMSPRLRMDWAKGLPFEVPQVGGGNPGDVASLADVEYLFWVGCAGAYEDRQKRTTRAVAELLHTAGVAFAVLGDGEACTGDSARRSGNEFLFQQLAMQNVELLNEAGARKIVVTCAHCFNTLANEYPQLGGNYEVVHHTQLLNRLVRDKKLTPVAPVDAPGPPEPAPSGSAAPSGGVTYHDPCYIGRHNGIYEPPRELISALPGVRFTEMPRNSSRSFCCGAGGARMWMEETLGTRINNTRAQEAIDTGADTIAVGCPFCNVMLSDGLTNAQSSGTAREQVQVQDVAQLLLAAVRRGSD